MDLSTNYMGFRLKNPIIAGSSGLNSSVENIVEAEKSGAAMVVLKSLFEEQISFHYQQKLSELSMDNPYPEAEHYISQHTRVKAVENYLELIRGAKKAVSIPVVASLNCVSMAEWTRFAREIEIAGVDGIELNIFILPTDINLASAQVEELYQDIMSDVIRQVSIPVSVKVSSNFSGMAKSMLRFSFSGIKGIVLFNRFYSTDIDIEKLTTVPANIYSSPNEIYHSLRWIALLSERIYCDVAASTGIHDGEGLVKVLLAGARAGQICSAIYQEGYSVIGEMLGFLESYMKKKGFSSVSEMIGKMSIRNLENPADYERVQFMKHFSGIE